LVVRYEYWPVFDEFADEPEEKLRSKREREGDKEGKGLTESVAEALAGWFCEFKLCI
jgi:hypothetical protein